ncbi:MAG: dihydrolipoyl dehydrogenase [Phenylobacterium sp.]|uniref:dihydrolipoyl dehydrogenase n=1 Tax=Phenylobacterium sp. TaxID=1871053 RepID=UPI0025D1546C|nr:dihydrolipoyl dehydrogenase [Phenylobacterium sp.]MCA6287159.1 dihydrolipoyl dehydrogenase [Phenylobacterium sp.]MCA6322607.1 dihydrolipoyl dehydrogenase [Phenylobacterium sp.]MCA6335979.1 dihydrolipoyl dehydrogenase [Phenylobacterium sp.]MCA6347579.1 dihydrolipoyl dehydrogenase [Phenylobacterium sp.]MCA6357345.1 dihydrolipoyl dehydrogenase [Phenylobacterium sp.]
MDFDLVVVGAGPGGYVAAIRAAQLGLRVAIIERDKLGGICLNWGCIPTKALLKSAETFETLGHLEDYGLRAEKVSFDLEAVVGRSRKVAGQLNAGVAFLMKKNKITVIEGEARLEAGSPAPLVRVALKAGGERSLKAANVILATGARARTLPDLGLAPDGQRVWSYREAMVPDRVPTSLLVVGSGAIGIEFASFYKALGSEVTVIEALPRILPVEDEEVSAAAQKAFEARGIAFRTGASVRRLAPRGKGVELTVEAGGATEILKAEVAIVAVGIVGNIEGLGLEALGVTIEKTHVVTDSHGATGVPGLWAIGDLAGPPWLAHKASHEGVHCVEHIAGLKPSGLTAPIPGCTYASPQIASVGLTEAQAKARGLSVKVGRFPLRANGKAIAAGHTEGFIKTVFDAANGALVGAHMIGADVTEMIQGYALAMTLEATEADLFATVFPHPTISEGMHEAALDAFGRALHV